MRSYEKRIATRRIDDVLREHRLDVLVHSVGPDECARALTSQPAAGHAVIFGAVRIADLAQLIPSASCLVEKFTRDRDCAIYDLRANLSAASGTEHQRVAARRPARNDLVAWTDDMQGQVLPHRFKFEPDGMPIAKPRSIEQRVKLLKLLSAGGC
jgi:hypothetical protein